MYTNYNKNRILTKENTEKNYFKKKFMKNILKWDFFFYGFGDLKIVHYKTR